MSVFKDQSTFQNTAFWLVGIPKIWLLNSALLCNFWNDFNLLWALPLFSGMSVKGEILDWMGSDFLRLWSCCGLVDELDVVDTQFIFYKDHFKLELLVSKSAHIMKIIYFSLSDFFTLSKRASNFDKKESIDLTKYSKPKICSTSELETWKYALFHCFAGFM